MPSYTQPRNFGIYLTAMVLASSLAACSNPLKREALVENNLAPTRTPSPQRAAPEPTSAVAKPTNTPITTESETTATAQSTSAPTAAKTKYALCSSVKPGLGAVPPTLATTPGRIAFLTTDSNLVLTDSGGRSRVNITSDAFVAADGSSGRIYQFPTFSADGQTIAFISMSTTQDFNGITQTVYVAPVVDSPNLIDLFATSEFGIPYLDFSPDGQQVAFLTISGRQGAIRVVNTTGGDVSIFDTGMPTYWHWRQDSAGMVTHLGGRAEKKGDAAISVIESKGTEKMSQTVLDALPGNFQSPHFSPDGKHMAYVANTSQTDELVLADATGIPTCTLAPVSKNAFFAWSPDGGHIAVMDTVAPLSSPAPVRIFELVNGTDRIVHEQTSAFFWSPDGTKLAIYDIVFNPEFSKLAQAHGSSKLNSPEAEPAAQQGSVGLRIEVVDVATGKSTKVADIYPSRQLQQYFQYFDQYSRSLSPWSPNGEQLVFATVNPTTETADVAVATLASTGISLKRVAAGTIAFWSPK